MRTLSVPRSFRSSCVVGAFTLLVFCLLSVVAYGHGAEDSARARAWWWRWTWEPGMAATLIISAAVYWRGLVRLRRATLAPWKLSREAWCYAGGWVALALALISPLHPLGQILFSVHMTQHEVLMLVAAPLLVLGQPAVVLLWAMERSAAHRAARLSRQPRVRRIWRTLTQPFVAWVIHAVALWIWHVPSWFEATLAHAWVHHVQHASFFFSALLFWHAILHGRQRSIGFGAGVLYLFTTAIHSGALGALITFAGRVWYPHYLTTTEVAGLSPLQDQQLGGLIMWIPAGLVYVVAALIMFAHWLQRSDAEILRFASANSAAQGSSLAGRAETGSWSGR